MSQLAEKTTGKPAVSLKDSNFVWEDPLDLEHDLSEEERMVRDTARGFAQDYLMPRIREAYATETYDKTILPEMGKLGLLGPTIPEEYGGAGLGYVAYGLIAREKEIMMLAAAALSNKEISAKLSLSNGTVKLHLHNVYQKLGISSRLALVELANDYSKELTGER